MILAMTFVLGWWIIPTIITISLLLYIFFGEIKNDLFCILKLFAVASSAVIILLSWVIYLVLRISFGII